MQQTGKWRVVLKFTGLTDWLEYPIKYETREEANKAAKRLEDKTCETRVEPSM